MHASDDGVRLLLASASPRRADLLRAAGYKFDVAPVDIDERRLPAEPAHDYVIRLAHAKAAFPAGGAPDRIVLGADTVVVVDDRILGKPIDDEQAAQMLRLLSGRVHEVLTGVALRRGNLQVHAVETTRVSFVELSGEQVRWYVATGEPRDKAGGYAVQGVGSRFVSRIEGSYSNVVGLPITVVRRLLLELSRPPAG